MNIRAATGGAVGRRARGDRGCRHERLAAHPRSVARAREAVKEFAAGHGASAAQCNAIALAISEAVANAIVHAYAGGCEDEVVELHASVDADALVAVVRDDGVGIGHAGLSEGLGLGLPLMARLSDELQIERRSPLGTSVRMTFSIG